MLKCENTIVQNLKNMTSIIRDLPILLQNFPVLGLDLNVHIIGMKPFLNILVGLAEKNGGTPQCIIYFMHKIKQSFNFICIIICHTNNH